MSYKMKNKYRKEKVIKKETTKKKSEKKLITHTAGKPSVSKGDINSTVSKAMPEAASAIPLISGEVPLVSKQVPLVSRKIPLVSFRIPLVSAVISRTLAKKWGLPSKKWGTSEMPATRKRGVKRPKDIGLFKFLGEVITSPVMGPYKMVKGIASKIESQTEEEREPKAVLEQELLELKMRREMEEISKEEYEKREKELDKRLEELNK